MSCRAGTNLCLDGLWRLEGHRPMRHDALISSFLMTDTVCYMQLRKRIAGSSNTKLNSVLIPSLLGLPCPLSSLPATLFF